MAAITRSTTEAEDALPVEEYIERFVNGGEKPTCEYVDGQLFQKAMGTKKHSKTARPNRISNITFARNMAKLSIPYPNSRHAFGKRSFMSLTSPSKTGHIPSRAPIQAPNSQCSSVLKSCHRPTALARFREVRRVSQMGSTLLLGD